MDISKLKTDVRISENGVWFYKDGDQKVGFLIARMGCKNFRESVARHYAPHNQAINRGALSAEKQDSLLAKVLAESILLDWTGITNGVDKDGKPKDFPYSKDACEAFLVNPEFGDLVKELMGYAEAAENYRAEEIKEAGNESKRTSAGNSPPAQ